MFPILILAIACFALVKFGVAQWRAIWVTSASQPLSDALQSEAGIDGKAIGPRDFDSLLDLCDQLSPGLKKSSPWLKEIALYYHGIARLEQTFRSKLPSLSTWANREMQVCSRYVAVMLDQNLSMNFDRRLAARAN